MKELKDHSLLIDFIFVEPADLLDVAGRPLGESRSSVQMKQDTHFEKQQCPYHDSRHLHEKPMNVTPLNLMAKNWKEIIYEIETIREIYKEVYKLNQIKLGDVWLFSAIGIYYPYFLLLRKEQPKKNREIPLVVSSYYKICIGLFSLCLNLTLEIFKKYKLNDFELKADTLYTIADQHHNLIGAEEVCAGPINLIKQVLDHMIHNHSKVAPPTIPPQLLSNDEYINLISFSSQICITILINTIYKKVEDEQYKKITAGIAEILAIHPSFQLFTKLDELLKSARQENLSQISSEEELFYQQSLEEEIYKLCFNDPETILAIKTLIAPTEPYDFGLQKNFLHLITEASSDRVQSSGQLIQMIQDFFHNALTYIEKEKVFVELFINYENRMMKSLGYTTVYKNLDRKALLKYYKYDFTDSFQGVFKIV